MIERLDEEVTMEYWKGYETLLQGDRVKLEVNLLSLLDKSVPYKQSWLGNIKQEWQQFMRLLQQDNDLKCNHMRTRS